jgi:hypothetical protein
VSWVTLCWGRGSVERWCRSKKKVLHGFATFTSPSTACTACIEMDCSALSTQATVRLARCLQPPGRIARWQLRSSMLRSAPMGTAGMRLPSHVA